MESTEKGSQPADAHIISCIFDYTASSIKDNKWMMTTWGLHFKFSCGIKHSQQLPSIACISGGEWISESSWSNCRKVEQDSKLYISECNYMKSNQEPRDLETLLLPWNWASASHLSKDNFVDFSKLFQNSQRDIKECHLMPFWKPHEQFIDFNLYLLIKDQFVQQTLFSPHNELHMKKPSWEVTYNLF
jgi:hypothetical protein